MYAVVEIAGKQIKVSANERVSLPTLPGKAGDKVKFDKVLLLGGDSGVSVGNPFVSGAHVEGRVLNHTKGEKVVVFKKKKRKGYRLLRGHRQNQTEVEITKIAK
jgi:large subunit ribosomal protein L21